MPKPNTQLDAVSDSLSSCAGGLEEIVLKRNDTRRLKPFVLSATQAQMDFTPADFLDGLEQAGTPVMNGQTLTTIAALTLACDESAGVFNCLNLYWNRAAYALDIYALGVYRAA